MAKSNRVVRGQKVQRPDGSGTSFEEHVSYDDSLLPDAMELAKLKQLDPDIMDWIKCRTAKEQDARLDLTSRKLKVLERTERRSFTLKLSSIMAAFLIIVGGMCFSYFLLDKGMPVMGSVFAGATILFAARSFLGLHFGPKDKTKP